MKYNSPTAGSAAPTWRHSVTHSGYTIAKPYFDSGKHAGAVANLYDSFAAAYNDTVTTARKNGDHSRQPLRASHRALFLDLVFQAKGQMDRLRYDFAADAGGLLAIPALEPYTLYTNRKHIARRSQKSESAIYRQILRLMDAGAIVDKVGHGTHADFELLINPILLPISDFANEQFDPLAAITAYTQLQAPHEGLRAKCTPIGKDQNILNNGIIPEQKVESALPTTCLEQTGNTYRNTGSSAKPVPTPPDIPAQINTGSEINTASKINTGPDGEGRGEASYSDRLRQHAERTRRFAVMFVEYLLKMLFASHNIYPAERRRAYEVAEYYFRNCQTTAQCNMAFDIYRQRVDLAATYIARKNFDFSNIYPAHYLDPDNRTCGFGQTEQWLHKLRKYKEFKQRCNKSRKEEAILQKTLVKFYQLPTIANYMSAQSYIRTYVPNKIDDFHAAVSKVPVAFGCNQLNN